MVEEASEPGHTVGAALTRTLHQCSTPTEFSARVAAAYGEAMLPAAFRLAEQIKGAAWCQSPQAKPVGPATHHAPAYPDSPSQQSSKPAGSRTHTAAVAEPVSRSVAETSTKSGAMGAASTAPDPWMLARQVAMQPTNVVLLVAVAVVMLALLYPPWVIRARSAESGVELHAGFSYVFEPPNQLATIDAVLLALLLAGIVGVAAVLYVVASRIETAVGATRPNN